MELIADDLGWFQERHEEPGALLDHWLGCLSCPTVPWRWNEILTKSLVTN